MSEQREVQRTVYRIPGSLTEARDTRRTLIEEISGINYQLSNKDKRRKCTVCGGAGNINGTTTCETCAGRGNFRWHPHEYHAWRQRALTALRAREAVLRQVNNWLDAEEDRLALIEQGTPVPSLALIRKAYDLFIVLKEDGVDFEASELAVVEELRAALESPAKETQAA